MAYDLNAWSWHGLSQQKSTYRQMSKAGEFLFFYFLEQCSSVLQCCQLMQLFGPILDRKIEGFLGIENLNVIFC